jgi:cytochrome c biogenesis protein CcmG, thiol:disulfide interchange protein DsbE
MKHMPLMYHLLTVIVVAGILFGPARLYAAPRSGQAAPNFKVSTLSGQQVSLENYRGRVLVLDFFATWCKPCRASIPHLVEMNRKYGQQGLYVLGMSADEDGEKVVKAFADKNHMSYPVALAGESTLVDFGVRSVPVMFVIDKKGRVAEVFRGFTDEVARSSELLIKKLLAER